MFSTALPHPRTLTKWYATIDGRPGFTQEALNALKRVQEGSQGKIYCSLIIDEINLPHKLVQDVITRWCNYSKYYMCARLEEQNRAISLYISDNSGSINNVQNLSEREWMILQHCLVLLQLFEEITKKVSSTYSCISEVIPHTKILQKFLIKEEVQRTCSYVDSLRMALKEGLERRVGQFEDEKNYTIARLLDPRYEMNFFTPEKVPWVRRQFLAEYVRRSADMDSTSNSENESEPPAPLPYSGLQSQEGTHKALWTCYEELASAKQPDIEEPKSPIAIELDRYIADSLLSRDMCPYKWWSKYKFRFPLMSNMAEIFQLQEPTPTELPFTVNVCFPKQATFMSKNETNY